MFTNHSEPTSPELAQPDRAGHRTRAIARWQEMSDAMWECVHGCMWWDRSKPDDCRCWTGLEHLPHPFLTHRPKEPNA